VSGVIAVVLIASLSGLAVAPPLGSAVGANGAAAGGKPAARWSASGCASLGEAAGFAVFSDGEFNASEAAGTSISGRIAGAGNVALDGVSLSPSAGESAPEVVAGGNFYGGTVTGSGGTLNGGLSYGGTLDKAADFTVNGATLHEAPHFSFDSEFALLGQLSSSLAGLGQSSGASVELNKYSGALVLTGTGEGLNAFTVSAAQPRRRLGS
jgi:choice-of-anchor A domain-containing protein